MIELAILGVLKDADLHGYELKKRLREILGPLSTVSFGSLYPALTRLESQGAVKAVAAGVTQGPTIPMTGSFAGEAAAFRAARRKATRGPRNKKVYGITDVGERQLCERIADPADDERTFPVKLAFCRWCDPTTRLDLLQRRRATLAGRLSEREGTTAARGERLDRYVRSLLEHDTESTVRDIAWLDRLIASEVADHDDPTAAPTSPAPGDPTTTPDPGDHLEGTTT
ncbi:MAG TPA: PadR family transcriptional regulator [Acidimicrobiales bacterium]|nr:PadR family transcriptional regulator [Acidimicrobiales bacterium]